MISRCPSGEPAGFAEPLRKDPLFRACCKRHRGGSGHRALTECCIAWSSVESDLENTQGAPAMDQVFTLKGQALSAVPHRPMRARISGAQLEDALQKLIADYPQIISGSQIQPGSDDPPRFVLLAREAPIGQWSLDHLLADQFGVLTLVECKLNQNPEARRDVLGQMIEYAAHSRELFAGGGARNLADRYWSRKGSEFAAHAAGLVGETFDEVRFWEAVEDTLSHGRMRLIIAADELRSEVRTSVEYLNREMQNVEVLGLELRCYGDKEDDLVLVPRIIGQTQDTAGRKGGLRPPAWTVERVEEALGSAEEPLLRERVHRIFALAREYGSFRESYGRGPQFLVTNGTGQIFITVYLDGKLYLTLVPERYPGGQEQRDAWAQQLKDLRLLPPELDLSEIQEGKTAARRLHELTADEFERFETALREMHLR